MRQPELLARIARTDSKGIKSLQGMYDTSTNLWLGAKWWEDATILNTMITEMAIKHTTSYDGDVTETFSHYSNTKFSDGRYIGQHTDDMGWWLQTWIKAYDYFRQNEYLKMGEEIFGQMAKSWSGKCGGGIWWDAANRTYKNAISNELFLDGALKLYERTGNKYYLAWARREYGWFMHSGLINRQYLVNDGLNKKCKNNGEYTWTYTQGGLIQSLVDASHVFHRGYYLKLAQKVADANDRLNVDSHGILYEKGCEPSNSCSTNGTQFKGIYMQSLANLYFSNHNPADKAFILKNAGAIIAHDQENGKIGVHWDGPFANHNASTQSSGLDSLNAAILVKSVRH
ncbi:MAG: hypothetical protein KGH67_04255 [Candidatus Micrarchaeota archaeon]|nr:hypothetical protein [Candidatus Micrarchaeota archaeon]MDE1859714.1 hypothetical protein [Candidatus Micrarchaeota archaeon]